MNNYQQHRLVNMKEMIHKAQLGHYAVLHINAINYDWIKTTILTAQETHSPIIIALTEKSMVNMCDPLTVAHITYDLMDFYKITVPVALHLDHGSYECAIACIKAGFSSVMYDGSHEPFETNLKKTKELINLANEYDVSVEGEVGPIGGKEDGVVGSGELANPDECATMSTVGLTCLAAGIGNIHGLYPANWKGLDFDLLEKIKAKTNHIPLVLHGGTGIPSDQVQKAINLGVCKMNVGTETLTAFTKGIDAYFGAGLHKQGKGYDPRKYLPLAYNEVKNKIIEKLKMTGSFNKA